MNKAISLLLLSLILAACSSSQPNSVETGNDFKATGYAEPLEQEAFDQLTPEQQYQIANKILGVMTKGIPVDTYFDIDEGIDNLTVKETNFINNLRDDLIAPLDGNTKNAINDKIYGLDPETGVVDEDKVLYSFTPETEPLLLPLAQVMEYPLSRDMFATWMSYFLANSILFSAPTEEGTIDEYDVSRVVNFLEAEILAGTPIRDIIYKFLPNLSRWRISRSPNNHAQEAFEIYLGYFDVNDDVEKGAIACQEWFLSDAESGYQLRQTANRNYDPLVIFDEYVVTTCDDLFKVIAYHPITLLRVGEVIASSLLSDRSVDDRLKLAEAIVNSGAVTFEDMFKGMLFSKEFLLNTDAPISMENNILSFYAKARADRVASGNLNKNFLMNLAGVESDNTIEALNLKEAEWAMFHYKLGRPYEVPMDTLSFAIQHAAMREVVFNNPEDWSGGLKHLNKSNTNEPSNHTGLVFEAFDSNADGVYDSERTRLDIVKLSTDEFIDYLFLTAISRKATILEKQNLKRLYISNGWSIFIPNLNETRIIRNELTSFHDQAAKLTFDYISRLPEFYYMQGIN